MKWFKFKSTDIIIGFLFIFCLASSYIGFSQYFNNLGEAAGFWRKIYFTLQLFVFNSPVTIDDIPVFLNIGRFLSPILLAGTILNLLFSTLINSSNLFIINYRFKDHLIFCGLGSKSYLLIRDYLSKDSNIQIVVIEKNHENPYINILKNNRVRFIMGSADDADILKKANIVNTSIIFALTENDKTNINITQKIIEIFTASNIEKPIKIILHISDHFNMNIFKEFQERNVNNIDFHAFNIFQKIASIVVSNYCPDQYIDYKSKDDPQCHILIHGLNKIGEQIIKESIQLYHFANLKKLKITVVDDKIEERIIDFKLMFPFIEQIADLNFVGTTDIFNTKKFNGLIGISVCFISCDTESQSYELAKSYRQIFFLNQMNDTQVVNGRKNADIRMLQLPKIVVLMPRDPDILGLFENVASVSDFLNIERFSFYVSVCKKEIIADDVNLVDNIAMRIHNIYQGLAEAELMKNWERLTDREKDFNRYPARHLAVKLRYLNASMVPIDLPVDELKTENISVEKRLSLAKMEHNRWIAEKILGGYIPFEEIIDKDLQSKLKSTLALHKDIRPWDDLSETDRNKDSIITDNIHSIVTALGEKLINS